jgi:hypothetical protein
MRGLLMPVSGTCQGHQAFSWLEPTPEKSYFGRRIEIFREQTRRTGPIEYVTKH